MPLSTVLPDGILSYQMSQFWYTFEGLDMENVGMRYIWPFYTFYRNLVVFIKLWYLVVIWYIYRRFGMIYLEKSGNPVRKNAAPLP
jgi:hypothetical protein